MKYDFETFYLGESLEAYISIAQNRSWQNVAICSEPQDNSEYEILRISDRDRKRILKLAQRFKLLHLVQAMESLSDFEFILNIGEERVLLGRSEDSNLKELTRFGLQSLKKDTVKFRVLKDVFNILFWNYPGQDENFLTQKYWQISKNKILNYMKKSFLFNEGHIYHGKIHEINFEKFPSVELDSFWGKFSSKSFMIDSYVRLKGHQSFPDQRYLNFYKRVRLVYKFEAVESFSEYLFCDYYWKDYWIPVVNVRFIQGCFIFDVYTIAIETTSHQFLEDLCLNVVESLIRKINLDGLIGCGNICEIKTVATFNEERKFRPPSSISKIKLNNTLNYS